MSAIVIKMPQAVASFPASVNRSKRKIELLRYKLSFKGRRYVSNAVWSMFAVIITSFVPDDFYDWEDSSIAEFLQEDIREAGFYEI